MDQACRKVICLPPSKTSTYTAAAAADGGTGGGPPPRCQNRKPKLSPMVKWAEGGKEERPGAAAARRTWPAWGSKEEGRKQGRGGGAGRGETRWMESVRRPAKVALRRVAPMFKAFFKALLCDQLNMSPDQHFQHRDLLY